MPHPTVLKDTSLFLYNTLGKRKELFRPRSNGRVLLFTCGPSTYRRQHLGNYRTFLFEDVLQRFLEYSGYAVQRMINFTDVEDKAVEEAVSRGTTLGEITGPTEEAFFREARQLGIRLPEEIPRATTSVEQAVRLIRILLEKGYAYWHGGDVFFDPLRFTGFGALYGLDMSRWPLKKIRFRKDTYPGVRWNLGDFILWHGSRGTGGDISWDTEIGKGRPSWNIQDPAMIAQHMGYEIDVSCGGIDNLYRHHDYNKAVLEAVSGVTFAPYWMHGQHLLVQGKKMSKSKGNITYPEDILDRGFEPYHLRYYLLSSHYRSRLDFTWESFRREAAELDTLRARIAHVLHRRANTGREEPEAKETIEEMALRFRSQMNDDLDVAGAVSALRVGMERLEDLGSGGRVGPGQLRRAEQALREADSVLGVLLGSRDPDR